MPLWLRPVEIYLEVLSDHLPHKCLLFCLTCFSDSWINHVTACGKDRKVLIKAHQELLHYFVISLLWCIVLSVGDVWILFPKVVIIMHSSISSCCSAREKFCLFWYNTGFYKCKVPRYFYVHICSNPGNGRVHMSLNPPVI